MNSAKQVDEKVNQWKHDEKAKDYIAWNVSLACVGWPYVFGARGEYCTVQNRHARYSDAHPTIRTKCKGYDTGSCTGCKWYPNSERVRCYDCRGFTWWCLKQAGIIINGAGATSQWNTEDNWAKKGKVSDGLPPDTLVCLFVRKNNKMEHTGLGYKGETCECSSGVQHFRSMAKKWTHWAVPKGLYKVVPDPVKPPQEHSVLKRGSKGPEVKECQELLISSGYSLDPYGADGSFGKVTEQAVKDFQKDHGLTPDGIVGPKTWAALENAEPAVKTYTATISGLTKSQAEELKKQYPAAIIKED